MDLAALHITGFLIFFVCLYPYYFLGSALHASLEDCAIHLLEGLQLGSRAECYSGREKDRCDAILRMDMI